MILPHLILEEVVVKRRIYRLMPKKFIEELFLQIRLVTHGLGEIMRANSIVIRVITGRFTGTVEKSLIEV
ncbi:hypothetical protein EHJ13_21960 [Cronobacter dublinensis]|uniref:Uncharacterized protein n=1 Tax=Cronobacter dublinensis TaxID=413497 RepID=A0A9Q4T8U0_9ENTR|nr:hypothetical protein [Cronobacter dublinensis]NCH90075.1 hypothetical protein [Cronobacter dublinensis]